jgi:hypothetical protein
MSRRALALAGLLLLAAPAAEAHEAWVDVVEPIEEL